MAIVRKTIIFAKLLHYVYPSKRTTMVENRASLVILRSVLAKTFFIAEEKKPIAMKNSKQPFRAVTFSEYKKRGEYDES